MRQVGNKARLSALKFFIEWEIVQCMHWLKMLKKRLCLNRGYSVYRSCSKIYGAVQQDDAQPSCSTRW